MNHASKVTGYRRYKSCVVCLNVTTAAFYPLKVMI